jgi:osmotically-inducible protein OsmY
MKQQAEKAALRMSGVQGVANDIDVHLPDLSKKTDAELAEAAVHALRWNTIVPDDKIKVTVDHGWVTLSGELEWQYQKESAYKAVENLLGINGVLNEIKLKPTATAFDVKNRIASAFQRNASLESKNISVEVEGNKVILLGELPSFHDREEAERSAWAIPGVYRVENKIIVAEPIFADMV